MIFKFSCACGHVWQSRKPAVGVAACKACEAPITEAMINAAEPLGVESDGPNPCGRHERYSDACVDCNPTGNGPIAPFDPPSDSRAPELGAFGISFTDSREVDALRDLRALVLRTHAEICDPGRSRGPLNFQEWLDVVNAARAAVTPGTFVPPSLFAPSPRDPRLDAGAMFHKCLSMTDQEWKTFGSELIAGRVLTESERAGYERAWEIREGSKRATVPTARFVATLPASPKEWISPSVDHTCSHCMLVTHSRPNQPPPSPCPGCGK